jgi:hypothetical protein
VIINEEGWMPAKRELTMRQIRQTLRLAGDGISAREIGRMLGVARSTIQDNLKRAQAAELAWPLPADLDDAVLEARLFGRAGAKRGLRRRAEPAWGELVCELKRPGVNLMVLWEEYRELQPDGYGYSRYVAARVMWSRNAVALLSGTVAVWLTQHKQRLRLAYLIQKRGSP